MANISLEDLNPSRASFLLRGKKYYLAPFSLYIQNWAMHEFATEESKDGLQNLSVLIHGADVGAVTLLAYEMLEDKTDFPDVKDFFNAFGRLGNIPNVLMEPLSRTIGLSQPTLDELAEEADLKKFVAETKKAQVVGPLFLTFSLLGTLLIVSMIFISVTH